MKNGDVEINHGNRWLDDNNIGSKNKHCSRLRFEDKLSSNSVSLDLMNSSSRMECKFSWDVSV